MLEEMRSLDIKELNKMIEKEDKEGRITEKCYWNDLWNCVVEEQANDYTYAEVKDALPLLVSEVNYRQRRYKANSNEMGVDIRKEIFATLILDLLILMKLVFSILD